MRSIKSESLVVNFVPCRLAAANTGCLARASGARGQASPRPRRTCRPEVSRPRGEPTRERSRAHPRPALGAARGALPALLLIVWFVPRRHRPGRSSSSWWPPWWRSSSTRWCTGSSALHVPRYVGVFLVYFGFVAVVVVLAALIWPPVVTSSCADLTSALPGMGPGRRDARDSCSALGDRRRPRASTSAPRPQRSRRSPTASRSSGNVVDVGVTVVRQVALFIIIVVISIYMLIDSQAHRALRRRPLPHPQRATATSTSRAPRRRSSTTSRRRCCLSAASSGASVGRRDVDPQHGRRVPLGRPVRAVLRRVGRPHGGHPLPGAGAGGRAAESRRRASTRRSRPSG